MGLLSSAFLRSGLTKRPPICRVSTQTMCHGSKESDGSIATPHCFLEGIVNRLASVTNSVHVVGGRVIPAALNMALLYTRANGSMYSGTDMYLSGEGPAIVSWLGKSRLRPPTAAQSFALRAG